MHTAACHAVRNSASRKNGARQCKPQCNKTTATPQCAARAPRPSIPHQAGAYRYRRGWGGGGHPPPDPPTHIRKLQGGNETYQRGPKSEIDCRYTDFFLPLNPLCDIPSGFCFFTGPGTVTRSSLRMLRRVAAFCRPLRPVLLLVSFTRSRSPVVGVLGLCWMWHGVPFARRRGCCLPGRGMPVQWTLRFGQGFF